MDPFEEMTLLLRGIERLRWELHNTDMNENFQVWFDKYSRMQNLLQCLNDVCWVIHGERSDDVKARNKLFNDISKKGRA